MLIVDDQSTSRYILSQVIKSIHADIEVTEASHPQLALKWAAENTANLVLIDFLMPEMNGVEFVRSLKSNLQYDAVPVMMITVKKDPEIRYAALDVGVTDFINKPIDMHECTARSKNLLIMHMQHIELQDKSDQLQSLVNEAIADIKAREKETLLRLARVGEYKDYDTAMHLNRMSMYSRALADALGLSEEEAELIELAAPLHDIGKTGIPDNILLKKSDLTEDELKIMRKHPLIGFKILENSPSKYLQKGGEIALSHHEHFDGSGYPHKLKGSAIPLSARIVAVADVFDALTSKRSYKIAWSFDRAIQYICNGSGKQFDPDVVRAMIRIQDIFKAIYSEHASRE